MLAWREVLIWLFYSFGSNLGLIYQCSGIDIFNAFLFRYVNREHIVFKVIPLWELQDV